MLRNSEKIEDWKAWIIWFMTLCFSIICEIHWGFPWTSIGSKIKSFGYTKSILYLTEASKPIFLWNIRGGGINQLMRD